MADDPCNTSGDQEISDQLTDRYQSRMEHMGQAVADGKMNLDDFQQKMEDAIRLSFTHQAIAGSPDADARSITNADKEQMQADIAEQWDYLGGFIDDIRKAQQDGKPLTFVPARAALYAGAAKSTFWKQATGGVDLPTMPGDQQCHGNCGCSWDLQCETDDQGNPTAVLAYWRRSKEDSCDDCVANEQQYNPLRIEL